MSRKLVAYFSASGVTAKAAESLSDALGADLFEIVPKVRYTKADLDWRDKSSRSTIEMNNPASRPEIEAIRDNMAEYDVIFLGFPIWWYVAPTIVNTFLDSYDFSGKRIILFATSGSSGFGKTVESLKVSVSGTTVIEEGMLQSGRQDTEAWKSWAASLEI